MILAAAVLLGAAVALLPQPVFGPPSTRRPRSVPIRPVVVALVLYVMVGGAWGVAAGLVGATVVGRHRVQRDRADDQTWAGTAPVVVALIAAATRAGVPPSYAVGTAAELVDPAYAGGLAGMVQRWRYGLSARDIGLDRPSRLVARAVEQAQDSGAAPALALEHAAADLTADAAQRAQEAARRVGVRAALPLGVCLLPAFLCLGVVPLVASLLSGVAR